MVTVDIELMAAFVLCNVFVIDDVVVVEGGGGGAFLAFCTA